jgi:hypothetical protein
MELNQLDKFIGQKVLVEEIKEYDAKDRLHTHYTISNDDPVILEIKKETRKSRLRIWFPNTFGTADFKPERLNVHIDKKNGSFEIIKINWG